MNVVLLIADGGSCSCGQLVGGCWFAVCGCGGDVSCVVWSLLVRMDGETWVPTVSDCIWIV